MDGDFFQLLRRIQKEERNKSTLARVEKDFYKQLYSYIRSLERSVANDPFGNDQLLLNNAQRVATEICETRESKISSAANNNIYRSFHLFKKENPQFDLIDTTPLNLTPEEETLYFSLMDALRSHRYRISLDKIGEEKSGMSEYDDPDEDDDGYYEDSSPVVESRVNPGVVSEEDFFNDGESLRDDVSDGFSGESISAEESGINKAGSGSDAESEISASVDASVVDLGDTSVKDESAEIAFDFDNASSNAVETSIETDAGSNVEASSIETDAGSNVEASSINASVAGSNESDEVLDRLNQIKNSTVVEDEHYEPIEKQINNQAKVVPNATMSNNYRYSGEKASSSAPAPESTVSKSDSMQSSQESTVSKSDSVQSGPESTAFKSDSVQSGPESTVSKSEKPMEDRPQRKSSSTLDFDSIFANPDSQFDSLNFEHDYEADFANIESSSAFAEPSEADLMFSPSSKPKREEKPKSQEGPQSESREEPKFDLEPKSQESPAEAKPQARSSSIKAFAKKEELANTAVVIYNDLESFMGIDEKIYGPFIANDVVILPNITAKILIENNKAGLIDI